ncbi:MAG: hypothetical protein K6347_03775 [Campylobacterales bacterium]
MRDRRVRLVFRPYVSYKFLNSFVTGVVGTSVFSIYGSLPPITFSVGGVALALGLMLIAWLYPRIATLSWFYRINLSVEVVMLFLFGWYLLFKTTQITPLLIYVGYQLTFVFGGYLVRIETLAARKVWLLGVIDRVKQTGYLAGLFASFLFYLGSEKMGITSSNEQLHALYAMLLVLQLFVVLTLIASFKRLPRSCPVT